MTLPRRAPGHMIVADVISLTARVASAVALSAALLAGCAGSKTGGTTPVTNGGGDPTDPLASGGRTIEADALVKPKPNFFPPVDVAGWVCEPKSWNANGVALIHCVAAAGAPDLIGALKQLENVESAEPAK